MKRLVVGISGASGAKLGITLLRLLRDNAEWETHLVCSEAGRATIASETEYSFDDIAALADVVHDQSNIGASIASGSFRTAGMAVTPCSMKSLAAIAHGYADNLLTRAADVTLKERRKLVLLTRETPLHSGHLRNMLSVSELGAVIMPPVMTHYNHPKSIEDMEMHIVCKVMSEFGIDTPQYKCWEGFPNPVPVC